MNLAGLLEALLGREGKAVGVSDLLFPKREAQFLSQGDSFRVGPRA